MRPPRGILATRRSLCCWFRLKRSRPWQVIAASATIGAAGSFASHSILPALAAIRSAFHTDVGVTQLVVSLSLLAYGAGQLVVAPLSDRIGRRPITLTGLSLYVLMSALGAFAPGIQWLILARVVQAFGGGAAFAVARATIVDYFGPRRAATGIAWSASAILIVPMFAPTLGGYLAEFHGWQWIFGCCALVGTAVLCFIWARIPETHPPVRGAHPRPRSRQGYRQLIRSGDYMAYVLFGAFMTAASYTVVTGAPYVVIEVMHLAPSTYGNLFLIPAIGSFSGYFLAARIARRFGAMRLLQTGLVLGMLSAATMVLLAMLHVWHPLAVFLPATGLGFANALGSPSSTSSALATHPHIAGTASGVLGFTNLAIAALTTQLNAHLANHTPVPFAWMVLAQVVIAGGMLFWIRRRHLQPAPSQEYDGSETVTL